MYLFHSKADVLRTRGFTLVELLVSFAIMTLISSVVLVRFNGFDSTVLLKSQAYEIASSIRDAQVYAVSSRGESGSASNNFKNPYGITFTPGATTYTFFRYKGSGPSVSHSNVSEYTDLSVLPLDKSMFISEICVTNSTGEVCSSSANLGLTRLDIGFKRPEFKAIFFGNGTYIGNGSNILSAKVKVKSTNGTTVWVVSISLLGQISVTLGP